MAETAVPHRQTAPAAAARTALMWTGIATFVLMGAGQALFGPALPIYQRVLSLTTPQASWIISAFWVGCFLGVAGMYAIGARVTPRGGLAGLALGAVLLALGSSVLPVVAGLALFRFLQPDAIRVPGAV